MLNISVLCVGRLREQHYIAAFAEYEKRLKPYCKFTLTELPEERLPQSPSPAEIWRQVDRDPQRPVVLICRSGRRSVEAGEHLESEGFQNVINVRYGFEGDRDEHMHRNVINGWRVDGLPWEQS